MSGRFGRNYALSTVGSKGRICYHHKVIPAVRIVDVRIGMLIVCPLMPVDEVPKLVYSAGLQFNGNAPGTITDLPERMRTAIPAVETADQVNDIRPYHIRECECYLCFVSLTRLYKAFINHKSSVSITRLS